MRLIIPRASLVGLLFEQPEKVRIVESAVLGLHQHDPMTWKTPGMDFQNAEDQTRTGKLLGQAVRRLIDRMPVEMREDFVEAIYEIVPIYRGGNGERSGAGLAEKHRARHAPAVSFGSGKIRSHSENGPAFLAQRRGNLRRGAAGPVDAAASGSAFQIALETRKEEIPWKT